MFSQELEERGFKNGTWNFHESGHGKGAPDGIGGALKRAANLKVLHGKGIVNATLMYAYMRSNKNMLK